MMNRRNDEDWNNDTLNLDLDLESSRDVESDTEPDRVGDVGEFQRFSDLSDVAVELFMGRTGPNFG